MSVLFILWCIKRCLSLVWWCAVCGYSSQCEVLTSLKALQKHIDSPQLTRDFDGTFSYDHSHFIHFRQVHWEIFWSDYIRLGCRNTFNLQTLCFFNWQKIDPFANSCSVAIASLQSSIETLNNISGLESSAVILTLCFCVWCSVEYVWFLRRTLLMSISFLRDCRMIEVQCVMFCRRCQRSSACRRISWRIFWKMLNWTVLEWRVGHFWHASGKTICVKMRTTGTAACLLRVYCTFFACLLHVWCMCATQIMHVYCTPAACLLHVCAATVPCMLHVCYVFGVYLLHTCHVGFLPCVCCMRVAVFSCLLCASCTSAVSAACFLHVLSWFAACLLWSFSSGLISNCTWVDASFLQLLLISIK